MNSLARWTMRITYEQAVYGSFPFWHQGYALLAKSLGCQREWLDALRLAGQRFGERPTGVEDHASVFAVPLPRGPWMIVGVFPNGCDDQGRPGARVFHGLFVSRWMYLLAGRNPFVMARALRGNWSESEWNGTLSPGVVTLPLWRRRQAVTGATPDPRIERVVRAIRQKRRVVIVSERPIDELAQAVWQALPGWSRRRASVASWAFGNDNRFDLVAVPRTAFLSPDLHDVILEPND